MVGLVLLYVGTFFLLLAPVFARRQYPAFAYVCTVVACAAWAAEEVVWGAWYFAFLFAVPIVCVYMGWRRWKAPFGLKVFFLAKRLGAMPPPDRAAMQGRRMAPRRWPL